MSRWISREKILAYTLVIAIPVTIWLATAAVAGNSGSAVSELAIDTNWAEDTVSIINLKTGQEKSRIKVGAKPYDIKTDQYGSYAYASLSGSSKISIIDLQANLEADRITVGESPRDMVLTKDYSRLIVANSGSNSISVVSLKDKKELFSVPVGLLPYGVGLADNERTAVVANWGEGTVSFVDLDRKIVTETVSVGHLPYTVVVAEGKGVAFTAVFGDDKVVVIDLEKKTIVNEISVGKSPWGLSATRDGSKVAVANFYSGSISISIIMVGDAFSQEGYSVQTYELRGKKPGDHIEPAAVASTSVNPDDRPLGGVDRAKHAVLDNGGTLMFTDLASNTVNTVDLNTNTYAMSVKVGLAPYGIDFLPQGRKVSALK